MRQMERSFEAAVGRALRALRLSIIRNVGDDPNEMIQRLDDERVTRPFQDAIARQLEKVAVAGAVFGRDQVEREVFGTRKGIEAGMWELANNAAAQWAVRYGYELVRGLLATTRDWLQLQVAEYVRNSETIGQLIARIREGSGFGEDRARRIAVTEVTRAFARGNMESWRASGVIEGKEWRTNNDELVCPVCGPLSGRVVGLDELFPGDIDGPPAHPNCVLPGNEIVVPGRLTAAAKSFYDGRAVEITVRSGRVLTVTENHPILTPAGYVAAKLLREGSYVVGTHDANRIAAAVNPDDDHIPTVIEEIFRSLKESAGVASRSVPVASEDFHGDGRAIYGDIDVVYVDGLLESDGIAASPEHTGEFDFGSDGMAFGVFPSLRHSDLLAVRESPAACCVVCGADLLPSLVTRHERPLEKLSLRTAARIDSGFEQPAANGVTLDVHGFGNSVFGFTGQIAGDDPGSVQGDFAVSGAAVYPGLNHDSGDDIVRHTFLAGEFVRRFAGLVAPDEIVSVRKFDFCGHVYDLQCDEYELYIVSGIIASNCRCWLVPAPVRSPAEVLREAFAVPERGIGITYSPYTGDVAREGLVFAPRKDTERAISVSGTEQLADEYIEYIRSQSDMLRTRQGSLSGNHFGLWFNPDDRRYYLDVSVVQPRSAIRDIIRQAAAAEQLAFYDLESGKVIDTAAALDLIERMPDADDDTLLRALGIGD